MNCDNKGEKQTIQLKDGTTLSCCIREIGAPVWIIATHGIGEHYRRHQYLIDLFGQYFNIFLYDLRGHGESSGTRGNIEDFDQYRKDLIEITNQLTERYRVKRLVYFGHSMGALITAGHLQSYPDELLYPERVFLSTPPVGAGGPLGPLVNALPTGIVEKLASFKSGLYLQGLVDLGYLSHEPHVKINYLEDPLNILKLHTHMLFGVMEYARHVFSKPMNCRTKLFCAFGTEDQVVSPKETEEYFTLIEKNAKIFVVQGAYHEMHNEIERYRRQYFTFLRDSIMDALKN
jgi:acylglycerol lipase